LDVLFAIDRCENNETIIERSIMTEGPGERHLANSPSPRQLNRSALVVGGFNLNCHLAFGDFRIQDSYARKIRLLADRLREPIPRDSLTPIPLFYNA
jgi:hypothetical protein